MALISTTGPICPNVTDTPLDNRSRVSTIAGIGNIPLAWRGMLVYCEENGKIYKVTSLKPKRSGPVEIENYYPATWVEFGSGGSTPSPTPSEIDAGDISYFSSGTFSNNTVGKELQSLASDILSLAEDIHNLSGDIGTLSNLNTENKQDLVAAINEVLASTGSTIAVVNSLLSDSTTDALSAYQGKVLKGLVDGKVAGIKVQGESSVLPMDGNGIVTIPAGGGGGTGTITGATVGGNPVTASGGILQFDAYPTANTMQYSSSTNYNSGTIGKEVKDLNASVNDLSTQVAELDKPSPTPSSSTTTVNLAEYARPSSSFTYDVDNKYVYNTKDTTFYQYSEEDNNTTVYYGVFKVIGEDKYLMYSITNNTTFTYVNTYTELTLPENAKKEFALGSVAVVKRVNGEGESWKNGTVNLFCTKQNMPLRNRCKNINFNGSTAWRVLIKSEDGNTIFVYKAKSNGNYEWEINVPRSSTANFNLLDKYFDRPEASNVSFDDSLTQLGTQQNPVDNVQKAINMLTTAIVSGSCILSVDLRDFDGSSIVSEYIGLSYVLNGTTVVLSDLSDTTPAIATDSNGIAHAVIPYGAQYTVKFNSRTNRQAIPDYTSIADINHINIFKYYNKEADKELVIIQVAVKNANNNDLVNYSLENKEVYIDYLDNTGTSVVTNAAITCYLNVRGSIQTWKEADSSTVYNYSETPIYINKGQYYRVRLQEWSPSLTPDEQELIKSENKSRLAQDYTRSFQMYYIYKKAGIFLVIEDYVDDTDLDTYTEYLCESYDDTNHTVTIIDPDTDDRYILKYDSSEGGIVRAPSTDPTNFVLWISTSNLSRVLGIGVRTSDTINNNLEYNEYSSKYTDCSFLIARNVALVNKKMQDTTTVWESLPIKYSGKAVTIFMAESQAPYCEMAQYLDTQISLKTGAITQHPFIPSTEQATIMANNKTFIKNALLVLNNTLFSIVGSTITTKQVSDNSFSFVNINSTSQTPISKVSNNPCIPIYCF